MQSFAIIASLLAVSLAAPAPLTQRQDIVPVLPNLPAITKVAFRVSNLEGDLVKAADTVVTVNGGEVVFDTDNSLVGAGAGRLNTGGHVYATRIDILSALNAIHCNLYNSEKHVIAELNSLYMGADFDGVEGPLDKAINADKYSLLCYYV